MALHLKRGHLMKNSHEGQEYIILFANRAVWESLKVRSCLSFKAPRLIILFWLL